MPNRLALERSPYLLQHANNPVDWYPWGAEAFARARSEDKPIFLSIGYSTCHWCHVMEHESFEDADVAALLNRDFIAIKVDREERPDVDRVYMLFVQATTGAGGWPMSVWLTPELKPFFGGTYFPPTSRWGRPGFVEVLTHLARAWHEERGQLVASAEAVLERLRQASGADEAAPDRAPVAGREAIETGIAEFSQAFDGRHGGFGGAPKVPRPAELLFLLEAHAFTGDYQARAMALETLRAMANGGMRDQIGGGFHRYSVDAEWRVPHFEKMLYDQGQLVLACLEAAQASGEADFAAIAEDTLDYVRREMTAPGGAFYSAEDADSLVPSPGDAPASGENREGAFYVWSSGELAKLLGPDAEIVSRRFGVEPAGNALSDPQGEFQGQNILFVAQSLEDVAVRSGRPVDEVAAILAQARRTLFGARNRRSRPHLDDKIITAWNGLMVAAFARAARVLVDSPQRDTWRQAAVEAARWIRKELWRPAESRLFRRYRDGQAAIDGFCEDYACLVWGLVELFQATGDLDWLDWALELTRIQTSLFSDERDGGWFSTTGRDPDVLLRLKEDYDGAEPAAASVTVRNLLALGHLTGDRTLIDRAGRTLERYGPQIGRAVRVMPLMVANVVLWHAGGTQIVLAGADGQAMAALAGALARHYLPWAVTVPLQDEAAAKRLGARWPWMAAMVPRGGAATAYVCTNFTCQAPQTDATAFDEQLAALGAPRRLRIP